MFRYYEKGQLLWLTPGAVPFDMESVELILPWLKEMREGVYPQVPSGGYTDLNSGILNPHAPFEAVCQLAAEFDMRLAKTGLDRYLVEDYYCENISEEELAQKLSMPVWEIRRRIRSAVSYIASGRCQRWVDCSGCVHFPKCRKRKKMRRHPLNYAEWVIRKKKYYQVAERR